MQEDTKCIKNERRTPLQVGLTYDTTSTGKRKHRSTKQKMNRSVLMKS